MNFAFSILLLFFFHLSTGQNLTLVTYNIRYDNPNDLGNLWETRKESIADLLTFYQPEIICLQEALYHQVIQLQDLLPHTRWTGVGRDNGKLAGEFCPIFFDERKVRFLEGGTFWLSETPEKPGSKGWGAACPRIVTYGRFQPLPDGNQFWVFNTHFDHYSEAARLESVKLLNQRIQSIAGNETTLIAGDFNCTLQSEPGIQLLSVFSYPASEGAVSLYGPDFTYKPFDQPGQSGKIIDHIFYTKNSTFRPLRFGILADNWNGKYPSDHLPVLLHVEPRN